MSGGADPGEAAQSGGDRLEILLTAHQAYPRLEALFLSAQRDIRLGFRLFDPRTKLLSEAARAVGETWVDLLLHTVNRGIPIDMTVSDFDPVMAFEMHRRAWKFVSIAVALNEISEPGAARLTVRCVLHPASGGLVPRLMFAPKTRAKLRQIADAMNKAPDPQDQLCHAPRLHAVLKYDGTRVRMRRRALPRLNPVTLHHKMAVIDAAVTYLGGLDLNNRRIDDTDHDQAAQQTWHDLQLISHDPKVAADATDFLQRLPDIIDRKGHLRRASSAFRTTVSRRRARNVIHLAPESVDESLLHDHLAQIAAARQFIYLETQYFRDRRLVSALRKAARRNPRLRLVVLLPGAPDDVAFHKTPELDGRFGEYLQARAIRRVRRRFGARFLAVSPVQPREPERRDTSAPRATLAGAPIVYVHSKVAIFDDRAAIVSSANLNGRSMRWDAEAGLLLTEPAQVSDLTRAVFGTWLATESAFDPETVFDLWAERARTNAHCAPEQRKGFIVPYDVEPASKIGVPIPGAPTDMV
ncbi:phospholipase D family protein [Pararhodobacter sp.]|uniref:phospholipase D family protein n=1 Tax=Pararhodobacter sp. TaxID=2127056 RepID=UPI002AFF7946|nr:phospholipase D-like domain-containing protein [Pararhodobacter sp.]